MAISLRQKEIQERRSDREHRDMSQKRRLYDVRLQISCCIDIIIFYPDTLALGLGRKDVDV
jgi:hypothetical protein